MTITPDGREYPIVQHFARIQHGTDWVTFQLHGDYVKCYADSQPMFQWANTPARQKTRNKIWKDFYRLLRVMSKWTWVAGEPRP